MLDDGPDALFSRPRMGGHAIAKQMFGIAAMLPTPLKGPGMAPFEGRPLGPTAGPR